MVLIEGALRRSQNAPPLSPEVAAQLLYLRELHER